MSKLTFDIKYKLGIAKESKDFFTCGTYHFCNQCKETCKPCETYMRKDIKGKIIKGFLQKIMKKVQEMKREAKARKF